MAENQPAPANQPEQPGKPGTYGSRPLWQWILLYIVVGGILYFVIYYFFFRGSGYTAPY